ncbi:MAG: hypothetical protein WD577_06115 [Bacteroidales bacterium]
MHRIFAIGISLLLSFTLFSQENENYLQIVEAERELKRMFEELYEVEVTGTNMDRFHAIDSLFYEALQLPGSFDHRWGSLDMIGKLVSDDGLVKVFSWVYMASRDQYHYTAFIQVQDRRGESELFRLNPGDAENMMSEDYPQSIDDWHGKVYYSILTNEYKRKTFYTLLGADFKDTKTSAKTIEVLTIQRGKPVFRDDQFLDGGTVRDRVVLEYSAELTISVQFNKRLGMIVFDHVVPLHPLYHGHYQFYGPDGSYNGYRFTEGIWVLEEDVDARN